MSTLNELAVEGLNRRCCESDTNLGVVWVADPVSGGGRSSKGDPERANEKTDDELQEEFGGICDEIQTGHTERPRLPCSIPPNVCQHWRGPSVLE